MTFKDCMKEGHSLNYRRIDKYECKGGVGCEGDLGMFEARWDVFAEVTCGPSRLSQQYLVASRDFNDFEKE
jgi:hypothetical protein